MRVHFNIWGRGIDGLSVAAYAVRHDYESSIDAVVRSLERTTGLRCCGGPRDDGVAQATPSNPAAQHYQLTLGEPLSTGGYCPRAEVWASIPMHTGTR